MSIELKLSAIYKAAHVSIPAQGEKLSAQGEIVSGGVEGVCAELSKVGVDLSRQIFSLGDEVVVRLRQVTRTMNECAVALDEIADDFAARDEEASSWFKQNQSWLHDKGYDGKPEQSAIPSTPKEG